MDSWDFSWIPGIVEIGILKGTRFKSQQTTESPKPTSLKPLVDQWDIQAAYESSSLSTTSADQVFCSVYTIATTPARQSQFTPEH